MTLEILLSCMNQTDSSIVTRSGITSDVLIINQCDRCQQEDFSTPSQKIRMISTTDRGLSNSRNMGIEHAAGDICLLCDDDETFLPDYEQSILEAFQRLPNADVIAFKITNQTCRLKNRTHRLSYLDLLKIKSWQIAFRRKSILNSSILFDPCMGAGSGNGAQEENKFLFDCYKAGLNIYYAPREIASVKQASSTWFHGFTEQFFYQRGASTRYFMGDFLSALYAVYYLIAKYPMYRQDISFRSAAKALFHGYRDDGLRRQTFYGHQSHDLRRREQDGHF